MDQYKNKDGTYTSPKNGKIYKSEKALRAHLAFKASSSQNNWQVLNKKKVPCQYCIEDFGKTNIFKHEGSCYLNPINLRNCVVCNNPIKDYKESKGTCSHSCSNSHFKELRNKPEKYKRYTTICWAHHKKECVICGEDKIVAVHHYNENHDDNKPENLIPLCPTHHGYVHSKFKDEVLPQIDNYIKEFKLRFA